MLMAFFKQTRYETDVWATALATLFNTEKGFHKAFIRQYPGVKTTLRRGFEEKRNTTELGVEIAGTILAKTIEELQDRDRCAQIAADLRKWADDPESPSKFGADPRAGLTAANADSLLWRIQWGIWWISKLLREGMIDEYYMGWFVSEMIGALDGRPHEERSKRRIINFINDAL
jgi:hypothetical protein